MDLTAIRNDIKLKLTGNVLNLEIEDETIDQIITNSLYDLQKYIDNTRLITIPYKQCIDLSKVKDPVTGKKVKVSAIAKIYRTNASGVGDAGSRFSNDPWQIAMWSMLAGGTGNYRLFNDFAENYAAYNTMLQIRNTLSTDLAYRFDKLGNKLYVNVSTGVPEKITVEYIPVLDSVEEIQSDYWIDILKRMSLAYTKIILGRIRTKYSQSNALWGNDGEKMLSEGEEELKNLQEFLASNEMLMFPVD